MLLSTQAQLNEKQPFSLKMPDGKFRGEVRVNEEGSEGQSGPLLEHNTPDPVETESPGSFP